MYFYQYVDYIRTITSNHVYIFSNSSNNTGPFRAQANSFLKNDNTFSGPNSPLGTFFNSQKNSRDVEAFTH